MDELKKAVVDVGYQVVEEEKRFDGDREKMERKQETRRQITLLILSATFSIPLLAVMFGEY